MKEYIRAFIEATDDGTLSDEQLEEFVNDSLYEEFGDVSEIVAEVMEERKNEEHQDHRNKRHRWILPPEGGGSNRGKEW